MIETIIYWTGVATLLSAFCLAISMYIIIFCQYLEETLNRFESGRAILLMTLKYFFVRNDVSLDPGEKQIVMVKDNTKYIIKAEDNE
jgi:hypothetical protein